MHAEKLDEIDILLLEILQTHGRTKRNELAERVNLSIPSVSERLKKLEESGYIERYTTVLNAKKIGLSVTAFIFVVSESSTDYPAIIKHAAGQDEILECHAITGAGSHLLKIRTPNTSTLEKLLSTIQSWPGVKNTITNVVLSSPKETTALPLRLDLD